MTDEEIIQLVENDAEARELMLRGADDSCATRLSEIAPEVPQDFYVTELTIFGLFKNDLTRAELMMRKIEGLATSESSPYAAAFARILKWLGPGSHGVNIGSQEIITLLSLPEAAGGLGLDEQTLKALRDAVYTKQTFSGAEISRIFNNRRTLA